MIETAVFEKESKVESVESRTFSNVEKTENKSDLSEVPKLKDTREYSQVKDIPCRNESLSGKEHPETGVPFEKKVVDTPDGKAEVTVPNFESKFDAQLPEDKYKESDSVQFKECNNQLKEAVDKDSKLSGKFDSEQLEQIKNGDTPDGYTWHHDAEAGKMQLVDTEIHQKTGHTGGRNIWGGGSENR